MQASTTPHEPDLSTLTPGEDVYLVVGRRVYPITNSARAESAGDALILAASKSHTDGLDLIGDVA